MPLASDVPLAFMPVLVLLLLEAAVPRVITPVLEPMPLASDVPYAPHPQNHPPRHK